MKSKYKFTSSRQIDGGGNVSEDGAAASGDINRGSRLFETETLGAGSAACELEELSRVHWIPRPEQ
jgi:hypothetical protein